MGRKDSWLFARSTLASLGPVAAERRRFAAGQLRRDDSPSHAIAEIDLFVVVVFCNVASIQA
jgi:hypothetical protein